MKLSQSISINQSTNFKGGIVAKKGAAGLFAGIKELAGRKERGLIEEGEHFDFFLFSKDEIDLERRMNEALMDFRLKIARFCDISEYPPMTMEKLINFSKFLRKN